MNKFTSLGISDEVVKAITEMGFEKPSQVQEKSIPLLLNEETDLVALAQTGTGKTAGFGLPLLEKVDFSKKQTQALILSPTRELAMQITEDIKSFSKYKKGVQVTAVYGGTSISAQIRELKRTPQIIVATPGRLLDMMRKRHIKLELVEWVILDEADEMLNMGFQEDIDAILSETPDSKNTWLFSATMPKEVARIASNYMNTPQEITCGSKNSGADTVSHEYYMVKSHQRYLALKRLVDFNPEIFGIVFCRTRADTQQVADSLIADGYKAGALHGDLSQSQRDAIMNQFRRRSLRLLVATDVAARGIDVNAVTNVIHYQLPDDIEAYTHRSGRTGRAGKTGVSMCIITGKDKGRIRQIERIIGKSIERKDIPDGEAVCEKQLMGLVDKISAVEVNEGEIGNYLPKVMERFEDLSKEDLIARFVSYEFNHFLEYYQGATDLNASGGGGHDSSTSRLFINLGEKDGFDWAGMKDYVRDIAGLGRNDLSRVDVKGSFSFVSVDPSNLDKVLKAFEGLVYQGRDVSIEISKGGGGRREGGGGRRRDGGRRDGGRGRRDGGGGSKFRGRRSYSDNNERPRDGATGARKEGGKKDSFRNKLKRSKSRD